MDSSSLQGWLMIAVVVGGPLLIGIFLFVFSRRRRLNTVEREVADEKTRENWGKERVR